MLAPSAYCTPTILNKVCTSKVSRNRKNDVKKHTAKTVPVNRVVSLGVGQLTCLASRCRSLKKLPSPRRIFGVGSDPVDLEGVCPDVFSDMVCDPSRNAVARPLKGGIPGSYHRLQQI